MLPVFHIHTLVLFDTGASRSFMSENFRRKLGLNCCDNKEALEISIPSGETINTKKTARGVELTISSQRMKADLYVPEMRDFDVILGIDWLSKNRATIKCYDREIEFEGSNGNRFVFYGAKTNTRVKDCQGFLVNVMGKETMERKTTDEAVVKEFLDVFPDDLPGIPPDRQVEFTIDLVPGAAPVSKAPYRMAPKELQELKIQIPELLDKKFIRSSVSPWGAPVLFVKKKDGTFRMCIDY
ncbi:hypothetical protein DH2020_039552 [Rehmannia glutinosa]|uniref:Uncharacterized protein n=1 Tax=Rehmannia glutinosa TaxID=99300 RepID=A0ABR0UWS8_REHGL